MVKIGKKSNEQKGIVLLDAGIHARDWITITSAMHVIEHLTNCPRLLNMFHFYIIPCLNPDGYEFSHTDVSKYILQIGIFTLNAFNQTLVFM